MRGGIQYSFGEVFEIVENDAIEFDVFTTDADSIIPVLSAAGLPGSSQFTDNADYSGKFEWQTDNFDAGTHVIIFYAVDGQDPLIVDSAAVTVTVTNVNRPPSGLFLWEDGIQDMDHLIRTGDPTQVEPYEIIEGDTALILVEMFDPDSTFPVLLINAVYIVETDTTVDTVVTPMYDNVDWHDSTNGYGTLTFAPDYYQSIYGLYGFRIRAIDSDDGVTYIQTILWVDVIDVPQDPELDPIPTPMQVLEGDSLELVITYSDADLPPGNFLTLSYQPVPANTGATNIDGFSSLFHFYPWFDQAGTYELLFRVEQNQWNFDTQTVVIEVLEAGPQAPILFVPFAPIDTVDLGSPLSERIWAIDPEGEAITMSALNLPANATFVDSGNGAGSFYFDPDLAQADSTFDVTFIASDGTAADTVDASLYVQEFVCGDVNASGAVDIDDVVFILQYMFLGGPAPQPLVSADVHRYDCPNVTVDIDDVTHLIMWIFADGPPPDCTCP
jgi:hypothetical protein